ncbi:efflux RND transporter periplasmic adaptor subunit [Bacteroides sp. OF04-15BH]|uniref:efflux RND transporter periplasmic adaptor subunit n=1 Tax=Bacteroides sp. OF04-15BH TaxID=2292281 RepID=UPI000E4B476C|nr:efflux RND transporter periplasmic adaptor subunit [Bacteroides sp. OF04-15BH]RHP66973.1 efflux RND transporter periplasmic adaptor subunit [Bacteroides sp. OF04-15BH]
MKIRKDFIPCAALIAFTLLTACKKTEQPETQRRSVLLTQPTHAEKTTVKTYSGRVYEAQTINLGFKVAGQISKIYVQEGDFVRQGQLVAQLDDKDYRLGVEALQIQYDQVKDEVNRSRILFEQHSLSANDYEKAEAGLRQLKVQLQSKRNQIAYTRLYAPTDGYVQSVNFSPAEMVDAGTAVLSLMNTSQMEVVTDIPAETYLMRDQVTEYSCHLDGTEQSHEWPMRLLSLLPQADGNQLYRLRLAFDRKPEQTITAGMNIEVRLRIAASSDQENRLTLPLSAIFRNGKQICVWVLRPDSTVEQRPITVADEIRGDRVIVTEGLKGNEQIVRAGVHTLQPGEKVKVLEKPSETNVGGLL